MTFILQCCLLTWLPSNQFKSHCKVKNHKSNWTERKVILNKELPNAKVANFCCIAKFEVQGFPLLQMKWTNCQDSQSWMKSSKGNAQSIDRRFSAAASAASASHRNLSDTHSPVQSETIKRSWTTNCQNSQSRMKTSKRLTIILPSSYKYSATQKPLNGLGNCIRKRTGLHSSFSAKRNYKMELN